MLVNRRIDPDKSVAPLTPTPQQDEAANANHANPVGECFICRDGIMISEDFETCTTCGLFHTQCMNEWWKYGSYRINEKGCRPICKTKISIPVAEDLDLEPTTEGLDLVNYAKFFTFEQLQNSDDSES